MEIRFGLQVVSFLQFRTVHIDSGRDASSAEALTRVLFRKEYLPSATINAEERVETNHSHKLAPKERLDMQSTRMNTATTMDSAAGKSEKHTKTGKTVDWKHLSEISYSATRFRQDDLSDKSEVVCQTARKLDLQRRKFINLPLSNYGTPDPYQNISQLRRPYYGI